MKNTLILSTAFAVGTTAMVLSSVAEQPLVSPMKQADTNNFNVYIQKFHRMKQQDAHGEHTFQSDRTAELQKFGISTATLSKKASKLLLLLKKPDVNTQNNSSVFLDNKHLYRQLFDEQIIPVWSGTDWLDGRSLILNSFKASDEIQKQLVALNYWEQSFGVCSVPERKKQPFAGSSAGTIIGMRLELVNAGYELKFDKTFNIWRIMGTNTPAAYTP